MPDAALEELTNCGAKLSATVKSVNIIAPIFISQFLIFPRLLTLPESEKGEALSGENAPPDSDAFDVYDFLRNPWEYVQSDVS